MKVRNTLIQGQMPWSGRDVIVDMEAGDRLEVRHGDGTVRVVVREGRLRVISHIPQASDR